LTTANAEG